MGLFVDLIELGEQRTNDALEMLCKAHHDDDDGIWAQMDSPLLRMLVELFTRRGLDRLDGFRAEVQAWAGGHRHKAGERVPRPAGAMERWNDAERALAKLYLEHLPPAEWTLDDHMLAIDYTAQRYLPADDLRTEAEWLATRSSLMGRVQAAMEGVTVKQASKLLEAMPSTVREAMAQFGGTPVQAATMQFAATRCAENVRNLADDARHKVRAVVAEHVTQQQLGAPLAGGSSLETKLMDKFGVLNRDMRRIAVTEAGEAQTQGYVASLPLGSKVKRVEQYKNACAFCRRIDGKVVTIVDPAKEPKDWENEIWAGKSNVGRSASPRKRIGNVFKEREPEEMWVIPAGLVHPHCRGRWVPTVQDRPGDDADFGEWMRGVLTAPKEKDALQQP